MLEAWSGALVFSRRSAFVPEVELASWGRSLAALIIAAILATGLRALTTVFVPILVNRSGYDLKNRLVTDALQWTGQTLLLIVLLVVIWVLVASLTWVGVRLAGGRQGFRIHAHLMAVAVSAWDLLGAIFAAMIVLVPYVLANVIPINLPFERLFNLASIALGVAGFTWIAQGVRTAHNISATRAITVAVLTAVVGAVVILGLNLLTGGGFAARVGGLLVTYFMPWLG